MANIEIKVGGETTTFQAVKKVQAYLPGSEEVATFVEEGEITNNLEYKTITQNGVYVASPGYYGISGVNVNVQHSGGENFGFPIEMDDAAELLEAGTEPANAGKIYKYTGTESTMGPSLFAANGLYICIDDEGVIY